ncbi:hypothetical protein CRM22_007427 [Opisthorchis felineus]|uniref:PX domain-containing protein n=1 Tax=Opisthorchis felineus TaxID=147828 RepID=A0A4S2LMW1_OPIFE|nr:hypothetical protein CRM22_007427 [Opisthorchis felineus]
MEGQNNDFGHESPACIIDEQDLSCSHFIQSVANLDLDQCSPSPASDPVRNGVKARDEVPEKPKIFNVRVTDPVKVGDGMGAYIVYHVIFNGYDQPFKGTSFHVTRRFSDFLGLYVKIYNRHHSTGIIIPPAPDKNVLGSTKIKMSKDISLENEFVERRRVALERFLHRLLNHPVLREDPDLREFLEFTGDLPRSVNTQLLSGASAKKIFKNVGDAIGKIAYKMEDPDDAALRSKYFDLKFEELESWERQLKRLHSALSLLVSSNQDLASSKFTVSRTISQLANVEEHTGLAQALGRLADTEEEVSQQHAVLAEAELTYLVDFAHDTLGMIQACKDALDERVKAFRNWKTAEALLRMKREQKVRLELAGRYDQRKMVGLDAEIDETTKRVEQEQERFNNISSIIKVEMERVDLTRFDDLKQAATGFLEVMLQNQEKHLETWEAYLLRARSIN